ncbi:voltage-gated potassium channel, partial [Aureobasidium melanogenum]
MGDTVVQLFSNATEWIGSLTVLPSEQGVRSALNEAWRTLTKTHPIHHGHHDLHPGGVTQTEGAEGDDEDKHLTMTDRIADRMAKHLEAEELEDALTAEHAGDFEERDIHFYNFLLARETQRLLKDLNASPPKRYEWGEWEYFLKLMANDADATDLNGDILVPEELRLPETREEWKKKHVDHRDRVDTGKTWSVFGERIEGVKIVTVPDSRGEEEAS